MLSASVRRDAWRASGVSVLLFANKWNNLSRFEKARGLLWWWPLIIRQAAEGPQGGAWRMPPEMKPEGMMRLFAATGDDAGASSASPA